MIDYTSGLIYYVVVSFQCSPAEVNFFHVEFKIRVESPKLIKYFFSNGESRPRRPEDVRLLIILSLIDFNCIENPASAKGIAKPVDISAGGTGILKMIPVPDRSYFWLNHSGICIIKSFYDRLQPLRSDFHIIVQKKQDVTLSNFCTPVITAGIAKVLFKPCNFTAWIVFSNPVDSFIITG